MIFTTVIGSWAISSKLKNFFLLTNIILEKCCKVLEMSKKVTAPKPAFKILICQWIFHVLLTVCRSNRIAMLKLLYEFWQESMDLQWDKDAIDQYLIWLLRRSESSRKRRWKIKKANQQFLKNPYQAGKAVLDP